MQVVNERTNRSEGLAAGMTVDVEIRGFKQGITLWWFSFEVDGLAPCYIVRCVSNVTPSITFDKREDREKQLTPLPNQIRTLIVRLRQQLQKLRVNHAGFLGPCGFAADAIAGEVV